MVGIATTLVCYTYARDYPPVQWWEWVTGWPLGVAAGAGTALCGSIMMIASLFAADE